MASQINASNSGFGGIVSTGDSSGELQLQTAGTTAVTINTSQNVGIGTTSPNYKLTFGGQTGATATPLALRFSNDYSNVNTAASSKIFLYNDGSGTDVYGIGVGADSDNQYHAGGTPTNNNGKHKFFTNDTERMRIDSSGRVTTPFQTAFSAFAPTDPGDITTANTLINRYSSTSYNIGSNYDTSLSRFTAPVAGIYYLTARAWVPSGATFGAIVIKVNGTQITEQRMGRGTGGQYTTIVPLVMWKASANDYFEVYTGLDSGGTVHTSTQITFSNFSGYLLG